MCLFPSCSKQQKYFSFFFFLLFKVYFSNDVSTVCVSDCCVFQLVRPCRVSALSSASQFCTYVKPNNLRTMFKSFLIH